MSPNAEDQGIVFVCDRDGTSSGSCGTTWDSRIACMRDRMSTSWWIWACGKRSADFLTELRSRQAAYDWEITVPVDGTLMPLHFSGARIDADIPGSGGTFAHRSGRY